jgi:hypothetical protein
MGIGSTLPIKIMAIQGFAGYLVTRMLCFIKPSLWVQTGLLLFILLAVPMCSYSQKVVRYKETYANGKVKLTGKMKAKQKEDFLILFNDSSKMLEKDRWIKVGFWIFYNENGKIVAKERWKKGEFIWRIEYNEKQKPAKSIDAKGKERFYKGCNCKN